MDTPIATILDIPALLAEISPEFPCGDDSREDASPSSPYFNLKDLRSQARALERQVLVGDDVLQISQWKTLAAEIPPVLARRSKDLEFVAWLIEALCREHGFAGLAQGFDLARQLIETHWQQLHPQPDEDGNATRIAPLVGLNGSDGEGTLIQPILSIPLFFSPALGAFATWHAEQAAEINRLEGSKAQARINAGGAALDDLRQAVQETALAGLLATDAAIAEAQCAFAALSDTMDRVMAGEPQPTSHIRKALERCRSVLAHQAGATLERARAVAAKAAAAEAKTEAEESSATTPGTLNGALAEHGQKQLQRASQSRNQALEQLRQLAEFFRQTEPHSPVSYAISQAIRWSELALPDLMQELIADKGAREGFCRMTGVPAPGAQE